MTTCTYPPVKECEDIEVGVSPEGKDENEVHGAHWGHELAADPHQLGPEGEERVRFQDNSIC